MIDGLTIGVEPWLTGREIGVPDDVRALMQDMLTRHLELQTPTDIRDFLASAAADQPVTVAKLVALKAARSWFGTDSQRHERAILIFQIPLLALIGVGTVHAYRRGGQAQWYAQTAWLVTLYFWAMTIVALSVLRYMVPVICLLLVLPASAAATRHEPLRIDEGISER